MLTVLCAALLCQTANPQQLFERERLKTNLEAGKRHLDLGVWCRNLGLVPQATSEFIRAVEASEGQHPGTVQVLGIMRNYDDAFWWRNKLEKPSRALVQQFHREERRVFLQDQKARFQLGMFAQNKKLFAEARKEFFTVLDAFDGPLPVNQKGCIVLEVGTLPDDFSKEIRAAAIAIHGDLYRRDALLERMPAVTEVFEKSSDRLRVRSLTSNEDARAVHALGEALFPLLENDLSGRPTRRMNLFLVKDRKDYESFQRVASLSSNRGVQAFVDADNFTVIACREGIEREKEFQGICLRELARLFEMGVGRAVMPVWYREGFVESYGAPGTIDWDGKVLRGGGRLDKERLDFLRAEGGVIPLRELLRGNAQSIMSAGKDQENRFKAQCWAFRSFMQNGAGAVVAGKFEQWELMCRGAAIGSETGKRSENMVPAMALFDRFFGLDITELEAKFMAYLAGL